MLLQDRTPPTEAVDEARAHLYPNKPMPCYLVFEQVNPDFWKHSFLPRPKKGAVAQILAVSIAVIAGSLFRCAERQQVETVNQVTVNADS